MSNKPEDIPCFVHDGFEVNRPWRDCGAVCNTVDPSTYGFVAIPRPETKKVILALSQGGKNYYLRDLRVESDGAYRAHPGTLYQVYVGETFLAGCSVADIDAFFDEVEFQGAQKYLGNPNLRALLQRATEQLNSHPSLAARELASEIIKEIPDLLETEDVTFNVYLEFTLPMKAGDQLTKRDAVLEEIVAALTNDAGQEDSLLGKLGAKDFVGIEIEERMK